MFIVLKDSTIRVSEVVAVTKSTILATLNTPEYYAMNIYLKNIPQPIVHIYTDEEERSGLPIKTFLISLILFSISSSIIARNIFTAP